MILHFTQPQPLSQIVIPYILTLPITTLPASPQFQASHLLISTFCLLSSLHLSTLTLIILWPSWDLQSIEPIKFSQQPIPLMSLVPSLRSLNSMFHACVLNSLLVSTHLFLLPGKIPNLAKCNHQANHLQHPPSWWAEEETRPCRAVSLWTCPCVQLSSCIIFLVHEFSPFLGPLVSSLFLQAHKTSSVFAHDFDSYFSEEIEAMRK